MVGVKIEQTIKPAPSPLEATQVPRHLSESPIDSSWQNVWIYSHYQAFEQNMDDFSHRPPNRACPTRFFFVSHIYTHWNRLETEPQKRQQTSFAKEKLNNQNPIKITCLCGVLHMIMNWWWFFKSYSPCLVLFFIIFPWVPFATSSISLWCFGSKRLALWGKWKKSQHDEILQY